MFLQRVRMLCQEQYVGEGLPLLLRDSSWVDLTQPHEELRPVRTLFQSTQRSVPHLHLHQTLRRPRLSWPF